MLARLPLNQREGLLSSQFVQRPSGLSRDCYFRPRFHSDELSLVERLLSSDSERGFAKKDCTKITSLSSRPLAKRVSSILIIWEIRLGEERSVKCKTPILRDICSFLARHFLSQAYAQMSISTKTRHIHMSERASTTTIGVSRFTEAGGEWCAGGPI